MSDDSDLGPLSLRGRVAIVTGGTKGIGKVIAETFLRAGGEVVVCARNEPASPVTGAGRGAAFVAADVRDPDQVQHVVDVAAERFGRLDILVNNAGGAPPVPSAEASPRFNEKVMALNLMGPMAFAQSAYRQMITQPDDGVPGVIINISRANPFGVAYGAAKAGLVNMAMTLAHEWGPRVRVLTITAGLIVTEEAHLYYGDEEGIAAVGRTLAMGRMGQPQDVADACLFLVSPLARWITGTNVEVHGGGENPAYLSASTGDVTDT
jgi:NAD(P)-dependent dehydrogenase (short-subunit alcohol dehydrogenase family)